MNKSRKKVRVVQLPTWMGEIFLELARCQTNDQAHVKKLVLKMAHQAFIHSLTPSEEITQ